MIIKIFEWLFISSHGEQGHYLVSCLATKTFHWCPALTTIQSSKVKAPELSTFFNCLAHEWDFSFLGGNPFSSLKQHVVWFVWVLLDFDKKQWCCCLTFNAMNLLLLLYAMRSNWFPQLQLFSHLGHVCFV